MSRQSKNSGSGNDGSWFLEAVGAVPIGPTPSETVAALEKDNTLTDLQPTMAPADQVVVYSSFDGDTGTSTSAFEPPARPPDVDSNDSLVDETGEIMVDSRTPEPESEGYTELSPVLRTRRPFRWPVVVIGLFVVAALAAAVVWLPEATRRGAVVVKQSYADASLALRLELPSGQAALDTVTDPSTDTDELSAAVPAISQLDSVAHALSVVAAEPVPRQLPVIRVEEVAGLEALQDSALINAAQGSDIARRLGHTYVYRTTIPQLLTTGDLPTSADVQTINTLSVSLASSLVDDSNALGDLPTTEAAADLNDAAHAAVERFALWQDEYLSALVEGDEAVATSLIAELDDIRLGLNSTLVEALGIARIEIDQRIVELAESLESYLEILTR
jgi:hypothetical protein